MSSIASYRLRSQVIACPLHINHDTQRLRPGHTSGHVKHFRIRLARLGPVRHPLFQDRGNPANQLHVLDGDLWPPQGVDYHGREP